MTKAEIEIVQAIATRVHLSRLTRSAKFIEGLIEKPDLKAYRLNATKRLWLFSLLCRYRKTLADVHDQYCENPECRKAVETKQKVVQLAFF